MAFQRQVRAVYGPVATWTDQLEARTVDDLDAETILLACEKMVVREMPTAAGSERGTMELEALTDALIEGQTFTARADRMAYAQAKELLVLEGRGGNDARLWRQTRIGGPTSQAAARKILYWRATNRIEVDDARFFDISQFGDAKKKQ
jgi:lipopolysaccharide export system protein LptA